MTGSGQVSRRKALGSRRKIPDLQRKMVSRRKVLALGPTAATQPLVHIRTAGAAGKVSVGFWDHWVPGGNDIMRQQVNTWAAQNKVDVQVDFITSNGNKLLLTAAAEAQARTGHDVMTLYVWDVHNMPPVSNPSTT
jgi:ABC-type glycerol-3-phosphate transport system substrate-binding protein